MEQKKSPKANLEKQRSTFFQIGLVISLVLILLAFECTRSTGELTTLLDYTNFEPEEDFKIRTWPKDKPKPKVEIIKPKDVIEIIDDDDEDLEDELEIDTEDDQKTAIIDYDLPDEEPVIDTYDFHKVEDKPEFPGGMKGFFKFIYSEIEYPREAIRNNVEGTVFIGFVVNEKGWIEDIQIERGVHSSLDIEAVRVMKLIPKWKPANQGGKAVRVKYSIPIKFKLN